MCSNSLASSNFCVGTVAAEDACHAACYAQELKNLKRETWSAKQPLRAP